MQEDEASPRRVVTRVGELDQDSMRRFVVGSIPVLLVHAEDGSYYAIQDTCTHEDFSLSQGELLRFDVECPAHGSRFDVRTGRVRNLPAVMAAKTYRVEVEGENIVIDVSVPAS